MRRRIEIDQAKAWDTDTLATLGTLAMLGLHTVYTVWWGYVWCGPRLLFVSLSVGLNLLLDGSIHSEQTASRRSKPSSRIAAMDELSFQ